jgi:hypothetical protein
MTGGVPGCRGFKAIANRLIVGPILKTLVFSTEPELSREWVDSICRCVCGCMEGRGGAICGRRMELWSWDEEGEGGTVVPVAGL